MTCIHHFILPTPDKSIDNGTPIGHCLNCGAKRRFKNFIDPNFNTRTNKKGSLNLNFKPKKKEFVL